MFVEAVPPTRAERHHRRMLYIIGISRIPNITGYETVTTESEEDPLLTQIHMFRTMRFLGFDR
jgi:hypothetical protein